jgi:hypothetical protein
MSIKKEREKSQNVMMSVKVLHSLSLRERVGVRDLRVPVIASVSLLLA